MSKFPFNLRLPDSASPIVYAGKQIGWLWPTMSAPARIDRSIAGPNKKQRFACCTLDGQVVTQNSRTKYEAKRSLVRALRRKAEGKKIRTHRIDKTRI